MKAVFNSFILCFLLLQIHPLKAQTWVDQMADPNVNFYEVQKSFEKYWEGKTIEKGSGWKKFKRWEYLTEQLIEPNGNRSNIARALNEGREAALSSAPRNGAGNWTSLGPSTVPSTGGGNYAMNGGSGRINCIRFSPNSSNIIYVGSATGGLWKSTNGGSSWTCNTDNLPVLSVSDIAIDPGNINIMYLATGDGDYGQNYSVGILKSVDGGDTWNPTGLDWTVTQGRTTSKLLINPDNTNTLIAATSNGVYRTTDAGISWTLVIPGSFKDAEFKPGDPNTVYVSGSEFWKSTNGGVSFTRITNGLPFSSERIAIGVSPANSNYVYLLAGANSFQGLYRSGDNGTNFTTRSTSPNILGWSSNGNTNGSQAWYDLAIAVSPTNAEEVIVGGINIWRSTNGGSSWTIKTYWDNSVSGVPYVHADHHDLVFLPGSGTTFFSGNDGGIWKTTNNGTSWTNLSNNLQIADMYRLGASRTNSNLVLTGWQDNGTNLRRSSSVWENVLWADGMECIISHANANTMYASIQYGAIYKSTNEGDNFTVIVNNGGSGINSEGEWITPYAMHPDDANLLILGKSQVYRSENGGSQWAQVGDISGGTGKIRALAIAPSNTNYIYAAKKDKFFACTNGSSFIDRTGDLPVSEAFIKSMVINPGNPNNVWVTFSGFSAENKVWVTNDAGVTWTNYTGTGLPNLPTHSIVHQGNSSGALYLATHVGVYYRNNTMSSWEPFFNGLPNVMVQELEISNNKIKAATYGRGLWESSLLPTSGIQQPIADFSVNTTQVCSEPTIQFTDESTPDPLTWNWTFQGGTPGTSTLQNPTVTYNNPGTYDVSLTVTNANGSSTISRPDLIDVGTVPLCTITSSNNALCIDQERVLTSLPANGSFAILSGPGTITNNELTAVDSGIIVIQCSVNQNGCTGVVTQTISSFAYAPGVITSSNASLCPSASRLLTATPSGGTFNIESGPGSINNNTLTAIPTGSSGTIRIKYTRSCMTGSAPTQNIPVPSVPLFNITSSNEPMCEGAIRLLTATPTGGTFAVLSGPGNITGNTLTATGTGTVVVQYSKVVGSCTGIATQSIVVNPIPTAPVITSSNSSMCPEESRLLTATPSGGIFTVTNGPGNINGNTLTATGSGTITVQYNITVNGCSNSVVQGIPVIDAPAPTITSSNSSMCPGDTRRLLGSPSGCIFSVISGPGTIIDNTLHAIDAGTIIIQYSCLINGCIVTATQSILVESGPASLCAEYRAMAMLDISVYPNPANGNYVTIYSETSLTNARLRVYTFSGELVSDQANLNGKTYLVDISGLPKGIFFLEIIDTRALGRTKFINN